MDSASVFFYVMGHKGYTVLQRFIHEFGAHAVEGVVTARDPGVHPDYYDELVALCRENGIGVHGRRDQLSPIAPYAFAISWRWIIESGQTRLIVLHDSLLPRYRGFNPLVSCLINGESEIGVTAFFASGEYDRGPIISQARKAITHPITIQAAISAIAPLYADLVCEIFDVIRHGRELVAHPQDERDATYSLWRDEEDYRIDWTRDAEYLQPFVLAVGPPYRGARTCMSGEFVRVFDVEALRDVIVENRTPGKVIFLDHGSPIVVCVKGLLKIKNAVRENDGGSIIPSRIRTRFS